MAANSRRDEIIEEQNKIIKFLMGQYEKDTGIRPKIPQSLGEFLNEKSIIGGPQITDQQDGMFDQSRAGGQRYKGKTANGKDMAAVKPKNEDIIKVNAEKPRDDYTGLTFMEAIESLNMPKLKP